MQHLISLKPADEEKLRIVRELSGAKISTLLMSTVNAVYGTGKYKENYIELDEDEQDRFRKSRRTMKEIFMIGLRRVETGK